VSQFAQAIASSSATTSAAQLLAGPFASASVTLKNALPSALGAMGGIVQSGVKELGVAVHASLGVFDNLITQTLTATTVNADVVNVNQKLCIGSTCITESQLQQLLQNQNVSQGNAPSSSGGGSSSSDTSTPPTITLNGANPATVTVGSAYTDLGGTVSGPGTDANLQLWASVDGAASTTADQIVIDTSTPSDHTIIFSVTDQNGLTGTAQRVVHVVAPDSNASSTDATSTTP
jgi:hypothetical protein